MLICLEIILWRNLGSWKYINFCFFKSFKIKDVRNSSSQSMGENNFDSDSFYILRLRLYRVHLNLSCRDFCNVVLNFLWLMINSYRMIFLLTNDLCHRFLSLMRDIYLTKFERGFAKQRYIFLGAKDRFTKETCKLHVCLKMASCLAFSQISIKLLMTSKKKLKERKAL